MSTLEFCESLLGGPRVIRICWAERWPAMMVKLDWLGAEKWPSSLLSELLVCRASHI